MRSMHKEIHDMLPDYHNGNLQTGEVSKVRSHLAECEECRNELILISELALVEVPDPGELFWKTLPAKVMASQEEKKRIFSFGAIFFSPFPFASAILCMVLVALVLFRAKEPEISLESYAKDPVVELVMGGEDLRDSELSAVTKGVLGDELPELTEDYNEYGYYRDYAAMNAQEIDGLFEALQYEGQKGG